MPKRTSANELCRVFARLPFFLALLLSCIDPIYAADGVAFSPNRFEVNLNNMGSADLNVYSQGNDYTDFGLYRDLPFTSNIIAHLGTNSQVHAIDVSVKLETLHQVESTFQPAFSVHPRKQGGVPVVGQMSWLHQRADLNHRVLAGFAIEACKKNARSWINAGNSEAGHFATDHTLPVTLTYKLTMVRFFTATYPNPVSQENSGTYTETVRTEKNIICHRNTARAPQASSAQFIVHDVQVNYSPNVSIARDRCGYLEGNVTIRTNKPNQPFSYVVVNRHTSPWGDAVTDERYFNVVTDNNGTVSDLFWDNINYSSRRYTGDISGNVRIKVDGFESRPLPYTVNCNQPRPNVDNIKKIGVNPTLQIPRSQLPGNAPITKPDAPDSRLQQNNSAPNLKLNKPNMGVQPILPNQGPTLKPDVPQSRQSSPENKSDTLPNKPSADFKQPQSPAIKPIVKPIIKPMVKPLMKTDIEQEQHGTDKPKLQQIK